MSDNHFNVQAFVVAGGSTPSGDYQSSVLMLLPGAGAWLPIDELPIGVKYALGSIVGGRLRVSGGLDGTNTKNEVRSIMFLAVLNSSIGDLVTQSQTF